jgi:hypothetical protein
VDPSEVSADVWTIPALLEVWPRPRWRQRIRAKKEFVTRHGSRAPAGAAGGRPPLRYRPGPGHPPRSADHSHPTAPVGRHVPYRAADAGSGLPGCPKPGSVKTATLTVLTNRRIGSRPGPASTLTDARIVAYLDAYPATSENLPRSRPARLAPADPPARRRHHGAQRWPTPPEAVCRAPQAPGCACGDAARPSAGRELHDCQCRVLPSDGTARGTLHSAARSGARSADRATADTHDGQQAKRSSAPTAGAAQSRDDRGHAKRSTPNLRPTAQSRPHAKERRRVHRGFHP